MIKKEIFIGFVVGLIANTLGLVIAIFIFGKSTAIESTIRQSIAQGFFTKLITMGAIMNLVAFFLFIRIKRDYRARGVILATVFVAILTFLVNFI